MFWHEQTKTPMDSNIHGCFYYLKIKKWGEIKYVRNNNYLLYLFNSGNSTNELWNNERRGE